MKNLIIYKFLSKVYDSLDMTYFRNWDKSPRKAVNDLVDKPSLKVLDICTGTATNIINIAKKKENVTLVGIDRSKEMLKIAKEKIGKLGLTNIKLGLQDATNMNFNKEYFDIALLSLVLHESSEELCNNILKEAYRVLKDKGRLLVTEWEEPTSLFKKLCFLPIKLLEPKGFREFLKMDLEQYFRERGFYLIQTIHCRYSRVLIFEKRKDI